MKPYDIKILPMSEYFKYQFKLFGTKHMLGLTNEGTGFGYPRIFALAYCDTARREIVLCKEFANQKILYHELGHELGLDHIAKRQHVMYPYFTRGAVGIPEIDELYYLKYGFSAWVAMILIAARLK
jgi:hypothetical protein